MEKHVICHLTHSLELKKKNSMAEYQDKKAGMKNLNINGLHTHVCDLNSFYRSR